METPLDELGVSQLRPKMIKNQWTWVSPARPLPNRQEASILLQSHHPTELNLTLIKKCGDKIRSIQMMRNVPHRGAFPKLPPIKIVGIGMHPIRMLSGGPPLVRVPGRRRGDPTEFRPLTMGGMRMLPTTPTRLSSIETMPRRTDSRSHPPRELAREASPPIRDG